MCDVMVR